MKRTALLPALLALAVAWGGCARVQPRGASVPPVVVIAQDTDWRGEVRVEGIVHVRKHATLTIAPGTRVLFVPKRFDAGEEHEGFTAPGFKVEGRVVAAGTDDAPVVFAPEGGNAHPGAWDKLLFTFSEGSRFDRCVFEGARFAFHVHFSELTVSRCIFRENDEGMRMGNSKVRIEDSVFTRNEIRGINFRDCRNEIRRNLVYGNGDGLFLHSKDAASVVRGNAIYANRHFNLRLGDLHGEDFDAGGNWWGSIREEAVRAGIYDGANLPGTGKVRIAPILDAPPVTGAEIRGVFVSGQAPVEGAEVVALATVADGFFPAAVAGRATTDADGLFRLAVPPGRWFVAGRKGTGGGSLFAFPGRNPVVVAFGERENLAMPGAALPEGVEPRVRASSRQGVAVRAIAGGAPVGGATVQAFRADAVDFRGPGEGSALTGESGTATLSLRPGKYLLAARKRPGGASLGVVEDGGLFGVWAGSPVEVRAGQVVDIEIPMVEKRGLIGGDAPESEGRAAGDDRTPVGRATLGSAPAAGHIVYFYRPGEAVGRPIARSSVLTSSGEFSVALPADGEYAAYLRRSHSGLPAGVDEERFGPVAVRRESGRLVPALLRFEGAPR
jgi:hypothetical protein